MNKHDFINILKHPQYINPQQTILMQEMLDDFPYFQSARAIYLKGLKNDDNYKYNSALKITAAYTANRSILFDYITSDVFSQQSVSIAQQQLQSQIAQIEVINAEEIISFSSETNDFDKKTLNPNLFEKKKKANEIAILTDNLEVDKPLNFNKNETHSFHEWLKLSQLKSISREDSETLKTDRKPNKTELINQFIANKPKIKPVKKTVLLKNLATQNQFNSEELMTETLAKVYLSQKNYKQAKQAYRILSLKYPEKSSFFAVRISDIKKLEKNNT